jgi:hypothetical protein
MRQNDHALGGGRLNRGHSHLDVEVRDHARAHFGDSIYNGDVYITHYGSSSQQTVAGLETSTKRVGSNQLSIDNSMSDSTRFNEHIIAMQENGGTSGFCDAPA